MGAHPPLDRPVPEPSRNLLRGDIGGRLEPGRVPRFDLTAQRRALTEADREIASGKYRGPLHGLPWGAKDLLAVKGYRTTWGAGGFEEQKEHYSGKKKPIK